MCLYVFNFKQMLRLGPSYIPPLHTWYVHHIHQQKQTARSSKVKFERLVTFLWGPFNLQGNSLAQSMPDTGQALAADPVIPHPRVVEKT